MKSVESEGNTIDEAIERALQDLQIGRDRVEVEILVDASRGLFGFGGRKARIRATVRAPVSVTGEVSESHVSRATSASPRHRHAASAPPRDPVLAMDLPALATRSRSLLLEILSHLGVGFEVEARPPVGDDAAAILLEVKGDEGGLVIGRRGQTLDALEYVLNRIVAREENASAPRIAIDVEGYRERRRSHLDELAHRLAEKAKQTRQAVILNPMSPRDRRIVHLALQGDEAIATRSQGQGYYRRMQIIPADRRGSRPGSTSRE